MNNLVYLIGRITKEPELRSNDKGLDLCTITLAVTRAFKNQDGVYESDFIKCNLWNYIAKNVCEYCHKGDLIGIKGRLQTGSYEKDGKKIYTQEVIAEKVSFLSAKSQEIKEGVKQVKEEKKDYFKEFGESLTDDDLSLPF